MNRRRDGRRMRSAAGLPWEPRQIAERPPSPIAMRHAPSVLPWPSWPMSLGAVLALLQPAVSPAEDLTMQTQRDALVAEVQADVRESADALGFSTLSPEVLAALREVPRHAFVPDEHRALSYRNHPLPIAAGQTISQPFIVAIMSQLIGVGPGERVFELGTGSGYQAAVLAAMGLEVYTVEIVPELAEQARHTLAELDYRRVQVRTGDGWLGWPEAAPFDGILVTAAAPRIPEPLIAQLKAGGHLVIPMGQPGDIQQLALYRKDATGRLLGQALLPVRFVPVTGPQGRR